MSRPYLTTNMRGFTLTELLVVIGIISALIAILLPSVARARDHANRIKCSANLRSIGQAMTAYTQRYRYYPGGYITWPVVPSYPAAWPVRLRPFIGENLDVFYCPSQDARCKWSREARAPNEKAGPLHTKYGYDVGERLLLPDGVYFSYGYNMEGAYVSGHYGLGMWADVLTYEERRNPTLATRVKSPADMIAIADTTADGRDDFRISPDSFFHHPAAVHGSGANVLFCDGHVLWYPQRELSNYGITLGVLKPERVAMARRWSYRNSVPGIDQ